MNGRTTARTIAGVAAVLALAGGGVAYAATNDTSTTPDSQTAPSAPDRPAPPGGPDGHGGPGGPGGPGFGHHLGGPGETLGAAASYLGLTEQQLMQRLQDGRSLADVARAESKSVSGLEDALVAAATKQLDRAVDDGWLGARARDAMLADLRERVGDLVTRARPDGPPRGGPDGPRFGGPGVCAPDESGARGHSEHRQ